MATLANIRLYNYTSVTLTSVVTKHRDLEDDGANFNNKTIAPRTALESYTRVKTGGGNGELTLSLYAPNNVYIGFFYMKDLKNPHEGLNSIEIPTPSGTYQFTYVAYRNVDGQPEDDRYTYLVVNNYPTGSTLP